MSDSYSSGDESIRRLGGHQRSISNPLHVLNMKLNPTKDFNVPTHTKTVFAAAMPKARDHGNDLMRSGLKMSEAAQSNADDSEQFEFDYKAKAPISMYHGQAGPMSRNSDGNNKNQEEESPYGSSNSIEEMKDPYVKHTLISDNGRLNA